MDAIQDRKLLQRDEVAALLQIPAEDLEWLINTRQLLEVRIRGHERFDSKDIFELIDAYKITSSRRVQ
jgi:hypothetical protein